MFAGAAFTDSADIKSTEAVDTLSALGVIDGYTDGSFKPNGTVTRAEMAKMIFVVWNGGKSDASAYQSMNSAFADTKNHWAAGYVNFCASNGIIAGKSATKFDPDSTVTGQEAAKMLLVVAGYDAAKAGLTGANWAQNTMSYAGLAGLFNDVDSPVEQALPRQYAAQMLFNALDVNRVKWSTDSNSFDEIQAWSGSGFTKETVGEKYMNLARTGKDVDAPLYLIGTEKEAGRDTYSLNTSGDTYIRVKGDYSDLVGQRIVVMHEKGKTDKVYGVSAYVDSKVLASGYVGQVEKDGNDKIKLDGTSYKVYNNNADTVAVAHFDNNGTGEKMSDLFAMAKNDGTALQNDVARSIKLIDNNGDGKVDTVVSSPVKFGKVTYVGSSSITVDNGVGSIKFDDATVYDGVKKDDYVYFTDDAYNSSDKDVVTKADVTSAEVNATRGTVEARVDGKWYRLANGVTVKSGSTYDMVLCGKYILNADETKGSLKDVAYLDAVKLKSSTNNNQTVKKADVDTGVGTKQTEGIVKARVYFADGTDAEVKLSKYDGNKLTQAIADRDLVNNAGQTNATSKSGLITYSKLSDGTYDIEFVGTSNKAGCDDVKTLTNVKVDEKIDSMPVNDDAVIFVKAVNNNQTQEIKVLTGKSVANWSATTGVNGTALTNEKNGLDYVAAGFLTVSGVTSVPGATADTKYGYLTRDGYTVTIDGEKKAAYDVWTTEGAKTLVEDASAPNGNAVTGKILSYTIDGKYIDDVKVEGADAAIIGTDRKVKGTAKVAMDNVAAKTYSFDEDCVFVAIDDSENEGAEGGIEAIPEAQKCAGSNYVANAIVVLKQDGSEQKIVAVFYDVDNMLSKLNRTTTTDAVVTDSHVHFAG